MIAAADFQKNIKLRNSQVDEKDQMLFRVGLNLGDVIMEGENLYGDGVNVAARLEALAEPGGISLSGKFHDEVSRKLEMSCLKSLTVSRCCEHPATFFFCQNQSDPASHSP